MFASSADTCRSCYSNSETNDGSEVQDAPMAMDEDSSDSCKESISTCDVKSEG